MNFILRSIMVLSVNRRLNVLPEHRLRRIRQQGFVGLSDVKLTSLAFGIRFPYRLCALLLILGLVTASVPIFIVLMVIALSSIFLPYHPFDYIYNHILRYKLGRPKLPPRGKQIKFSCGIAAIWMGCTAYFFHVEMLGAAYVAGISLTLIALLVSTTDYCVPSQLFNWAFNFDTGVKT